MVINRFHPLIGGAERQCLKLSRALRAKGVGVFVLTVRWESRLKSEEEIEGIHVRRIRSPWLLKIRGKKKGQEFFSILSFVKALHKYRREYDVIHVHQALRPAFAAAIASAILAKPVVCKIGNSGPRYDLDVYQRKCIEGRLGRKAIAQNTHCFVSISSAVAADLTKDVDPDKIAKIPNGVEIPQSSDRQRPNSGTSDFIFVYSGTFTEKKNLPLLLKAFAALRFPDSKPVKLRLVGDGPERQNLEALVQEMDLAEAVQLVGERMDVSPYLRGADCFVLPSLTEGLSNSLLEAMAHSLPCIATAVGGNPDLLNVRQILPADIPENGFAECDAGYLCRSGDAKGLEKALSQIVGLGEAERNGMGEKGFARVSNEFSINRVAEQYEALYARCTSGAG